MQLRIHRNQIGRPGHVPPAGFQRGHQPRRHRLGHDGENGGNIRNVLSRVGSIGTPQHAQTDRGTPCEHHIHAQAFSLGDEFGQAIRVLIGIANDQFNRNALIDEVILEALCRFFPSAPQRHVDAERALPQSRFSLSGARGQNQPYSQR